MHEVTQAANIIRSHFGSTRLKFNTITLKEPPKADYVAFRDHQGPRPDRQAFIILLLDGECLVHELIVSLSKQAIVGTKSVPDVLPILTLEDLDICEKVARNDAGVVQTCQELGIYDMSTVYFDGWAIGADERFGFDRRLQQGLAYWRASPDDNQYAHPLDFAVVVDTEKEEVLRIDIRKVDGKRVPIPRQQHNYFPALVRDGYVYERLKPIEITQPQGVSFSLERNRISWAGFEMHIGFNYREGIVLSDVSMHDMHEGRQRMLFNRLSVAEMVVPYGNPDIPHHRKHAFDIGEYGMGEFNNLDVPDGLLLILLGLMTHSLKAGCDCKGAIQYLDAVMSTRHGYAAVLPNAVCIHEEDNGLLYKHMDYRDGNTVVARDRKLIISQIITAANYEYGFYHTFQLDGTYKLEVKLTGILNTVPLADSEESRPTYGSRMAPGLNAHNHQHIFSLRVDPHLDGPNNSVVQNDAVMSSIPAGQPGNLYGNAFYCEKTLLRTRKEGACDYKHETSRTWDIINPNKINPACEKPVGYKIISRESPGLLCQPGGLVWKRAGFTRKTLWVTKYNEDELFPAGNYVCQSNGVPGWPNNGSVVDWSERNDSIENTDIVCWLQFGITHFPRTEDFPIMPAEPLSIMLRASNFFRKNPALWVPPTSHDRDLTSKDLRKCCEGPEAFGSDVSHGKGSKL